MNTKQKIQMTVDLAMVILLPLLMAYSLVGEKAHEWIGTGMFLLFILHHILNSFWLKNLFKGLYSGIRIIGTILDLLLLVVMFALPFSGIMMSRHVFSFLDFGGLYFARTLHLLAAYWGYILMSLHVGFHWSMISGRIKRMMFSSSSKHIVIILRMIAVLLFAYGLYAFFQRDIGSYLFLQNQFVFFDFSEPIYLFLADYLSVMCLFAGVGYYVSVGIKRYTGKRSGRITGSV